MKRDNTWQVENAITRGETPNLKFWNFAKNEATNTAELTIYGPIASTSWWEDEITPAKFSDDLKRLGNVTEITVRINSGGGDVFAANAIQNMLKDHPAKIIVKIDGWAASAATIIAMAGNEILIPDNGIFMIHNPSIGVCGHYGKSEFENIIDILETTKKSIITSYAKRTGKEEKEIAQLMDDETWYVGQEAVEAGFCDDLTGAAQKVNGSFITNNGEYKNIPQKVKDIINAVEKQEQKTETEEEVMDEKELREKYPDLVQDIENKAVAKERQRIKDIENISLAGFEELTNEAKFENPMTPQDLAVKVIEKQKALGKDFLNSRDEDIKNGKVGEVKPEAAGGTDKNSNKPSKFDEIIDAKYPEK